MPKHDEILPGCPGNPVHVADSDEPVLFPRRCDSIQCRYWNLLVHPRHQHDILPEFRRQKDAPYWDESASGWLARKSEYAHGENPYERNEPGGGAGGDWEDGAS